VASVTVRGTLAAMAIGDLFSPRSSLGAAWSWWTPPPMWS
jgi:hypothetical protein